MLSWSVSLSLVVSDTPCMDDCCCWLVFTTRQRGRGWCWRWALVSPNAVAPSRMVNVSASVDLPLHHRVQKFSSGTGSPGWYRKKGHKTVVVWCGKLTTAQFFTMHHRTQTYLAHDRMKWSIHWLHNVAAADNCTLLALAAPKQQFTGIRYDL